MKTTFSTKTISITIITISLLMVTFFRDYLTEEWFSNSITWDDSTYACSTEKGAMAIADKDWRRITIVDEEGKIQTVINTSFDNGNTPEIVNDITLDDNYLYIADTETSDNGIRVTKSRIRKYTRNGEYVTTILEQQAHNKHQSPIRYIESTGDSLYVLTDIGHNLQLSVYSDTTCIRRSIYSLDGKPIFRARYAPSTNTIFAHTNDGNIYQIVNGETRNCSSLIHGALAGSFDIDSMSNIRYIDYESRRLMLLSKDRAVRKLLDTDAEKFSVTNYHGKKYIVIPGEPRGPVRFVPYDNSPILTFTGAPYTTWHLILRYSTLFALLLLLIAAAIAMAFGVMHVRHLLSGNKENTKAPDAPISIYDLYCRRGIYLIVGFLLSAITMFSVLYQYKIDHRKSYMTSIARYISLVSPESGIGNHIERLRFVATAGSNSYYTLLSFVEKSCMVNKEEDTPFELGYAVIALGSDGNDPRNIISYQTSLNGHMLLSESYDADFNVFRRDSIMERVMQGEVVSVTIKEGILKNQHMAVGPIYNSKEDIVGLIVLNVDMGALVSATINEMLPVVVKMLTLLFLVILLMGEIELTYGFVKIRKQNIRKAGTKDITTCEGHRTLRVMNNISFNMIIPILPALIPMLVRDSSMPFSNAMLMALPLSARGLMSVLLSTFVGVYIKRNPRSYLTWAGICRFVIFIMCVVAALIHSYLLFLVAMILHGVTNAICATGVRAIRFKDATPHPRYSKFVFTSMEQTVAAAIGVPLGAFLCDNFGIIPTLAVAAVISLLQSWPAMMFVGSDINIVEEKTGRKSSSDGESALEGATKEKPHGSFLAYLFRRDMIAVVFFALLPIGCMPFLVSYLLPLYNAYQGNSVVIVGLLTMILTVSSFLSAPEVFTKLVNRGGNDYSIKIGLGVMSLSFLFFALEQSMLSFSVMLFVTGVFYIVMTTNIERIQIAAAKEQDIELNDCYGFFAAIASAGEIIAPIILATLVGLGYTVLGFVWAAVMAVCLLVCILSIRKHQKRETGTNTPS